MKAAVFFAALLLALLPQPAAAQAREVLPTTVVPTIYDLAITPDAHAGTFSGEVEIHLTVKQETHDIVLNAAELAFAKATLTVDAGTTQDPVEAAKIVFDAKRETATLRFDDALKSGGRYILTIAYGGKINNSAAGLFSLDYDSAEGRKRALYTQFENADARRFLPCWDEPGIKARFKLSAVIPQNETAVSNMRPIAVDKLPGGMKRVHFALSPEMSSYLLFYAQGDFERISRKVAGVDLGVVVKRGDTEKAHYALDAAAEVLPYYNDYFGTAYPLEKLDLIAGPGQSQFFGAMENWGAMFFFERVLLADPKLSGEADRRSIYLTVAHETAHQWFGDLVTMAWWDDLWLNEGFASWVEYKAAERLHPEWQSWLRAQTSKENAMRDDARAGTHPVIQPIADVLEANQAFDAITYQKGQASIRMLENYLGETAFRDGVRAYIAAHAYGNTVTEDLWQALAKTSQQPVAEIARGFTLQAGVPMIRAETIPGGIRLTQMRFAIDASGAEKTAWRIPVTVGTADGKTLWRGIVTADAPVTIALNKKAVPIVNAGQAGYFRTFSDRPLAMKLAAQFVKLSPTDQLGLLNDTQAAAETGYQPQTDFTVLLGRIRPGMHPTVVAAAAEKIAGLVTLYRDLPVEKKLRAFGLKALRPLFAKTGWQAKPGEDPNIALMRAALIDAMSTLDDPQIVSAAKKRFAEYVKAPATFDGDLRANVLGVVAAHADAATWDKLHELAKNATASIEKRSLYLLLGSAHDDALAARALNLALADEAPVTLRAAIVTAVAQDHPDLAFDFAVAHAADIDALLEVNSRNEFYPRLGRTSVDSEMSAKLAAFADAQILASARQETVRTIAIVDFAVKLRAARTLDAAPAKPAKKHAKKHIKKRRHR